MAKKNQRQDAGGSRGMVRALLAGAVGLVTLSVGGMAFYMVVNQYQGLIEEAKRPEDTVMVIVAARDLYQGVTVNEEDLYAVAIPPKYLPPDTFLAPEHVMGRVPRERILANEFIRAERLADPDNGQGVHALIPRGFRAISVEVSDGEALAGFLQPGNYVDVLNTLEPEEEGGEPITNTLLQAIFVLGVKQKYQRLPLGAPLYMKTWEEGMKLGVRGAEASLVLEDNHRMRGALEKMGGRIYKTYRSYSYPLVEGEE